MRPDAARVDPQLGRLPDLAEVQDQLLAGGVRQLHFLVVLGVPAVPPQPLVDPGAGLHLAGTAAELEGAGDAVLVRRRTALHGQHARLPSPIGDVQPARLQLGAFPRHPHAGAVDVQHVLAIDRDGELDRIRPRRDGGAEHAAPVPVVVEQGPACAVHQVPARIVESRVREPLPDLRMEAHGVLVVDLGGAEHRHRDGDRHVGVGPEIGLLARQRLEQPGSRDRYRGGRRGRGFHRQGGQPVSYVVTDQDVGCRVGTEAQRDGGAVAVALPRAPEGLARLAVPDRNFAGRPELERDRDLGGPGVADQIDLGAPSGVVRDPSVTGVDGVGVAAGHRDVGLDQAAQQRDQRGGIPNRVRPGTQVLHRG